MRGSERVQARRAQVLRLRNLLVLGSCLFLMVAAQLLWKIGLGAIGGLDLQAAGVGAQLVAAATSLPIVGGVALFGVSTVLWLDLLSRIELSRLMPLGSLTYVASFVAGWAWLGETPHLGRLVGILVICGGIYLVARSEPAREPERTLDGTSSDAA